MELLLFIIKILLSVYRQRKKIRNKNSLFNHFVEKNLLNSSVLIRQNNKILDDDYDNIWF